MVTETKSLSMATPNKTPAKYAQTCQPFYSKEWKNECKTYQGETPL